MKFIHPTELDPMIERRRGKAASINARAARPDLTLLPGPHHRLRRIAQRYCGAATPLRFATIR
jgi:hypothetical protein